MATDRRDNHKPRTSTGAEAPPAAGGQSAPSSRAGSSRRRRVVGGFIWFYLFFLFIYLLALAMTLFEIDAFQTLVAEIAGPAIEQGTGAGGFRQREIIQAVRSTQSPEGDGDLTTDGQKRALYERIAAKLDPLRVAVEALADISDNATPTVRVDETYERAQQEAFRDLAERIGLAVSDLKKQVKSSSGCDSKKKGDTSGTCNRIEALRNDLIALDEGVANLGALLPVPAPVPEQGSEQTRGVESPVADLRARVDALAGDFAQRDDAALVAESIASLSKQLDGLQMIDKEALYGWILGSFPEKKSGRTDPAKPAKQEAKKLNPITVELRQGGVSNQVVDLRWTLLAYGIKNNKTQEFQVDIPAEDEALRTMDERLVGILKRFQASEGVGVDGKLGRNTRTKLDAFRKECNEDPDTCWGTNGRPIPGAPPMAESQTAGQAPVPRVIVADLDQLRTALNQLKRVVVEQGVDLQQVNELVTPLAQMEVASRRLADLDLVVNLDSDPKSQKNLEESRRKFQKALRDLDAAIRGIRSTLGDAGGVVPIAEAIGEQDPLAHKKAENLLREFQALDRYQDILTPLAVVTLPRPQCGAWVGTSSGTLCWIGRGSTKIWNKIADIGFHAKDMATMTRQALDMMVILVMGAIGSLIYLTRYLLSQILQGNESGSAAWRPWSWYVFRPLFGVVVAFALYLLYKTGQVALGGGGGKVLASDVSLPILSVVALFGGLLSWQALEMIESKGRRWLSAQRREDLWASGLSQALRNAGKTTNDCASQVGVTPTQVDRWIGGQDKVTPEMQDRMTTWLGRERVEIFGDTNPRDIDEGTLRWATGLKGALKANKAGIDVPRLAQLIGQDVETVQAWVDLKRQVDQEMQFLIADKLGQQRDRLFTVERPDAEYWAVGLRTALRESSADALARAVGSTQQNIRRYVELKASVPQPLQNLIVETLALNHQILFSPTLPPDTDFKWAANLRDCLRKSQFKRSGDLAEKIDTEAAWVRSWMEQEVCGEEDAPYCGQVAPATQLVLAEALGCEAGTLFRSERAAADFKWVVTPRFGDLVEARGGISELASRLDLDVSRIERWIAGTEPVAPETQLVLLADLGLPVEERTSLFTSRPPVEPDRPEGVWWATGLRTAVREHPGYRTLSRLAAQLEIPVQTLFDQVELLAPVPTDLRDRITRLLGPTSAQQGPLFSSQRPDWSQFLWAPKLRAALAQADKEASA
jgi:plasmid maintenance system antidote protein VapI